MSPPFRRVLVANRGEIAIRVLRACRELGIATVAVYSEADADALHVRLADEAHLIGPAPSSESYLRSDRILEVARVTKSDAIHPGYGFLAENAGFARACRDAGIVFVGPPPEAMEVMGDKVSARQAMERAGVPVVPGTTEPLADDEEAARVAADIGYPVMIKASAGGGGKGMRRVDSADQLLGALRGARSEAGSSFGDDRIYVEKCIDRPRHVEVQVFSDAQGRHMHLFERDCSVQRRHQKLIEESPCPVLAPETRAAMTGVATRAAEAIGYVGAGTCEFLLAEDGSFYFLEMNTRLQVEHPVTEMVTGVDLVHAQLLTAAGRPLPWGQDDLVQRGHAIEVRITAEDVVGGFRPCPGTVVDWKVPEGPWVRVDGALYPGYEVPIFYDPMVAKLIVWGSDRAAAIARMKRALSEVVLTGLTTNLDFFAAVMDHGPFREGVYDTGYIGRHLDHDLHLPEADVDPKLLVALAAIAAEQARGSSGAAAEAVPAVSPWAMSGRLRGLRRA